MKGNKRSRGSLPGSNSEGLLDSSAAPAVELGKLELGSDVEELSNSSESGLEEEVSSISEEEFSGVSHEDGGGMRNEADEASGRKGAQREEEEEDIGGSKEQLEDPGSDSSEDERPNRNTVGNVPMEWYKHEDHVGYDLSGKRLEKRGRQDRLDRLLERMDNDGLVTTIYDEYNDEEVKISREELKMLMRIRQGRFPDVNVDPHWMPEPWFTSKPRIHPLVDRPRPKASFVPSKHEERIVLRLVRAIRKGLLKSKKPKAKPKVYMMWDEDAAPGQRTLAGLSYIPAPQKDLPGHSESYRPPKEYLPTEEEQDELEADNELREGTEDNPHFIPKAYEALRKVPAYERFINEVFERCLDLYLCPRARRKKPREKLSADSFIPKLPSPKDLQPFPMIEYMRYEGHTGKVRSVAPDSTGQWLASGGDDGTMKLWEVRTGRCLHTWSFGTPVASVAWCPHSSLRILSAAAGRRVILVPAEVGDGESREAAKKVLKLPNAEFREEVNMPVSWGERREGSGLEIKHSFLVKQVTWHGQGDYFASVAPDGLSKAVIVHRLSNKSSQNPFRKPRGKIVRVLFHPFKPILFVQSQTHVRVYNLSKQVLVKKLAGSRGVMSSMAIHPTGDHVLVGGEDERLCWFDLDLSTRPYKALKFHKEAVQSVTYHRAYPLFASASDDGTVQIFHGMVYNDLLTNAMIVPLKILKGHKIVEYCGVLDCAFHPTQPWIFTAGADATICLFCN